MTPKKDIIVRTILLLSAPCALHGADDSRALLSAHHNDINETIEEIFDDIYSQPSDTTYALLGGASTVIGGATGLGTTVALYKITEQGPTRFEPITATAATNFGLEIFKALPAAMGALASLFAGYKIYGLLKAGILSPIERKFDKLEHENAEFKQSVLKHQKEYEELTDKLIEKKLQDAEKDIKALLGEWFNQIDTTNGEVLGNLTEQERLLRTLRGQVSPTLYQEIDAIIGQNTHSVEKLKNMHEISPETLDKYTKKHKKGAMARFFGRLFHGKK